MKFIPRAEGTTDTRQPIPGFPDIDVLFVDGHTESQMLPLLKKDGRKALFTADLLPATTHIPTAWVMGYDTRPLMTVTEKNASSPALSGNNGPCCLNTMPTTKRPPCTAQKKGSACKGPAQRSEFDW